MAASFKNARDLILANLRAMEIETIPLLDAIGRALAEELVAPVDMPRWNNSAIDGYAVRAQDCQRSLRRGWQLTS